MTAGATTPGPTTPGPPGHVPSIRRRGLMLVLSSPSGAGKTSIAHGLLELEPELTLSVSVTTRPRRPGERRRRRLSLHRPRERYDAMVREGELLEHAEVYDHGYGTPRARGRGGAVGGARRAVRHRLAGHPAAARARGRYGHRVHPAALDRRAGAPSARPAPGQRDGGPQTPVQGRGRRHPLGRVRLRGDQQRPRPERAERARDPGGRAPEAPASARSRRLRQPVPRRSRADATGRRLRSSAPGGRSPPRRSPRRAPSPARLRPRAGLRAARRGS